MRCVIRTDGTVEELAEPVSLDEVERLIGAAALDTVNLRHLGWPMHVMLVDDFGYETKSVERASAPGFDFITELRPTKARKPVNEKATALYHANCLPGTTHQIVGDVVVMPDDDVLPDNGAHTVTTDRMRGAA